MATRIVRVALPFVVMGLLILLVWLGLSGSLLLFAPRVELAEPDSGIEGSGIRYYTKQFDGGVRNTPASEAALGTAQVAWTIDDGDGDGVHDLWLQVWHADATRVNTLRVTIHGSVFDPFLEIPQGDSWGRVLYDYTADGLTLTFPSLGAHGDGYRGTLFLRLRAGFPMTEPPQQTVRVEVNADLFRESFPLSGWRMHGCWELPLQDDAAAETEEAT